MLSFFLPPRKSARAPPSGPGLDRVDRKPCWTMRSRSSCSEAPSATWLWISAAGVGVFQDELGHDYFRLRGLQPGGAGRQLEFERLLVQRRIQSLVRESENRDGVIVTADDQLA